MYWVTRSRWRSATPATGACGNRRATARCPSAPRTRRQRPDAATARQWPAEAPTPEQVMYAQSPWCAGDREPDTAGRRKLDLYLVAFAGDGRRTSSATKPNTPRDLFARRFGARGHSWCWRTTRPRSPLARWPTGAIWSRRSTGLAQDHGPGQDILVLYLTSHGSADHDLLVDMDPLPLDQIGATIWPASSPSTPSAGKWSSSTPATRVASACVAQRRHAGMTAARSDRSSFGCGSESKITYFGEAFLSTH